MKENLSNNQIAIYNFLSQYIETNGFPPAIREICKATNISSTSTVHHHLKALEEKGYITKNNSRSRSITIVKESVPTEIIPDVGTVTAGMPILAVENISSHFPIAKGYFEGSDHFVLSVRGESMIDAGIYDGDKIIVNKTNVCRNGDIIVALIEDEATVKRFYKENGKVRLQPENKTMEPIIVDNIEVIGKVVGLFRKL